MIDGEADPPQSIADSFGEREVILYEQNTHHMAFFLRKTSRSARCVGYPN